MMENNNTSLPPGARLKGGKRDYTITRVLGQGGFGITYHAMGDVIVDGIETKAEFAIKEFFKSDHCYRDSDSCTMSFSQNSADIVTDTMTDFETEARRLFKLPSHRGIVKISEVFSANNTRYYAMQYLGNTSVDKLTVPMDEKEAVALITRIGEAVQFLHDHSVTHLDIKPQNILMRGEQPVLIDFGLSRHYDNRGKATTSSYNGGGYSEGYSPLEQYAGIRKFSPECDVYALAATLFYLLVGKRPIGAVEISDEWIEEHLPPQVSQTVKTAICQAMEQSARHRTHSVSEFISNLHNSPAPPPVEHRDDSPEIDNPTKPLPSSRAQSPARERKVTPTPVQPAKSVETKRIESVPVEDDDASHTTAGSRSKLLLFAVAAIAIIGCVLIFFMNGSDKTPSSEGTTVEQPLDSTVETINKPVDKELENKELETSAGSQNDDVSDTPATVTSPKESSKTNTDTRTKNQTDKSDRQDKKANYIDPSKAPQKENNSGSQESAKTTSPKETEKKTEKKQAPPAIDPMQYKNF